MNTIIVNEQSNKCIKYALFLNHIMLDHNSPTEKKLDALIRSEFAKQCPKQYKEIFSTPTKYYHNHGYTSFQSHLKIKNDLTKYIIM